MDIRARREEIANVLTHGVGLVASRDLETVLDKLVTVNGDSLLDALGETGFTDVTVMDVRWGDDLSAPLYSCHFDQVADLLGFVRYPCPE